MSGDKFRFSRDFDNLAASVFVIVTIILIIKSLL